MRQRRCFGARPSRGVAGRHCACAGSPHTFPDNDSLSRVSRHTGRARAHTRALACAFVQSTMADGAAAGGSSGGAPSVFASAKSARQALLLATQALSVNDAALREAYENSSAIPEESRFGGHNGRRPLERGTGPCGNGDADGPRAASAECMRQALLLVTQALGVTAAEVREARANASSKARPFIPLQQDFPLEDIPLLSEEQRRRVTFNLPPDFWTKFGTQ